MQLPKLSHREASKWYNWLALKLHNMLQWTWVNPLMLCSSTSIRLQRLWQNKSYKHYLSLYKDYISIRYHINILRKQPVCNTTTMNSVGVVMIVRWSEHFLDGLFLLINEVKEVNNNLGTVAAWWLFWGRRSNILLLFFEAGVLPNHSQQKQNECSKRDNTTWKIQAPKANQVKLVRLRVACPFFRTAHFTEPPLLYPMKIPILRKSQNCCRHVKGKRRFSLKSLMYCYIMSGNAKYTIQHN